MNPTTDTKLKEKMLSTSECEWCGQSFVCRDVRAAALICGKCLSENDTNLPKVVVDYKRRYHLGRLTPEDRKKMVMRGTVRLTSGKSFNREL